MDYPRGPVYVAPTMAKVPKLRRHVTGVYFVQFGGQRRYFTVGLEESEKLYRVALRDWTMLIDQQALAKSHTARSIVELVRAYLESRLTDASKAQHTWCKSHLSRLTRTWGTLPADAFNARLLQAMKADMVSMGTLAAKTINHDLRAIKSMFRWASDMGYCREVNLRAVKSLPLPQMQRKALAREDITRIVNLALGREIGTNPNTGKRLEPNPAIAPWLAVNYLAALRPSEVVRLVHGEGVWIGKGLFQPKYSKTFRDGRHPRVYILTDEALMWLKHAKPHWAEMKAYGTAARRAIGPGLPHPLRHSAATHLFELGVSRPDIDLVLGHYPRAVSQTYVHVELAPLRETLRRLSLGSIAPS